MTPNQDRMRSSLVSCAKAIASFTHVDEDEQHDLLILCKVYGSMTESSESLARGHADLVRDIALALAQAQRRSDMQEIEVQRFWASAYTDARHDIEEEATTEKKKSYKPTEEQIKTRVLQNKRSDASSRYREAKEKLIELRALVTLLEGLQKGLISRAILIRAICDVDSDVESEVD